MSERLIIITGASRGIGVSLAYELNDKFTDKSSFLLIARDQAKLDQVKAEMKNKMPTSSQNVIHTLSLDFSIQMKVEQVYEILNKIVNDQNSYKQLFVFYNHGTLKLSPLEKIADHVNDEFQINVTSVWVLMAAIRQMFPLNAVPTQFHVNISSLLATKVLKHFSIYNTSNFKLKFILK
jgi:short-subunit dehydrogenase